MSDPLLILGSSSESRIKMLEKIGYTPDIIEHPEVDETPLKNELPQEVQQQNETQEQLDVRCFKPRSTLIGRVVTVRC
jgi:predicted house-cleaning NTP pyrophosphatase (Maf/HAM1 superfamily)